MRLRTAIELFVATVGGAEGGSKRRQSAPSVISHSGQNIPQMILWIAAIAAPLALAFYLWIFIFIGGSSPKGQPYDKFIMDICTSSDFNFFKTLLCWGYFKRSAKECIKAYKLWFFPVPMAELGGKAPDAKLVDLDGKSKSLVEDYIKKMGPSRPLIINIGSYT